MTPQEAIHLLTSPDTNARTSEQLMEAIRVVCERYAELEPRIKHLLDRVHELEDESAIWEKASLVRIITENEKLRQSLISLISLLDSIKGLPIDSDPESCTIDESFGVYDELEKARRVLNGNMTMPPEET